MIYCRLPSYLGDSGERESDRATVCVCVFYIKVNEVVHSGVEVRERKRERLAEGVGGNWQ